MTDRLATFWFGDPGGNYPRMVNVLEYTAKEHCPDWSVEVYELEREPVKTYHNAPENFVYNVQKVDAWARLVQEAEDGDRICLLDADTMILDSLDPVWEHDFDFAYTGKRGKLVLNCGVIFVRVGEKSRSFIRAWAQTNHELIEDQHQHNRWRRKTPGMTQPALLAILSSPFRRRLGIKIVELPCSIWNCEESGWERFGDHVRILHMKGNLRCATFGGRVTARRLRLAHLAKLWHDTEAEADLIPARAAEN